MFQAYCKFATVPIKFVKTNNPWPTPTGELPVLDNGDDSVAGVSHIFSFLRKQVLNNINVLSRPYTRFLLRFFLLPHYY